MKIQYILIPTDFSACAAAAVHAGVLLARKTGAAIQLFSVVDIPENWAAKQAEKENTTGREMDQRVYNAEVLLQNIQQKYPDVKMDYTVGGGVFIQQMQKIVASKQPDIVVMGSHGVKGKNEFFIGSNTQKVVRMINRPTLVIKEPIEELAFKKVVFASSFQKDEQMVFRNFLFFIKPFEPELFLVHIQTGSLFDPPLTLARAAMDEFKKLAAPLSCRSFTYRDFTINAGIRNFTDEVEADLIVVSNHHRKPLKRMLTGSNVEALINHADIPVLSWDFE